MLFVLFAVFLFASGNDVPFSASVRAFIRSNFDIDFFSVAMTLGGLGVAVYVIYEQQKKK
ncbi:hypothetical protein ACFLW6_02825 [Chloroflexota bacterium]